MVGFLSFGLGMVLVWLMLFPFRQWLCQRRVIDIPNERSSHSYPIPRGGGLAIVVVIFGGLLLFALFSPAVSWQALVPYLTGAILVAGVSWLDDVGSVRNHVRLAAHAVGASLVISLMGCWASVRVPVLGQIDLGWLGLPITFLWMVGLTNAYNFMDGIDGIAAGQAVVAGLTWAILGRISGNALAPALGLLLAASSLGFLFHNWPPARIFMGDVGSAFLGFTFGVLPVIAARTDSRLALAGVLAVWPFVFDTTFTLVRRLCNGENVFGAHRSHLYQRLVIAGASQRTVTLSYIGLAVASSAMAIAWFLRVPASDVLLLFGITLLSCGLVAFVSRFERSRASSRR